MMSLDFRKRAKVKHTYWVSLCVLMIVVHQLISCFTTSCSIIGYEPDVMKLIVSIPPLYLLIKISTKIFLDIVA